nr:non-reducing end alpha-L-arabinofuranosidase family hydrolase [uncultured Duganella sp.]
MRLKKCGIGMILGAPLAVCGGSNAMAGGAAEPANSAFNWTSSRPLVAPQADPKQTIYSVKDPSILYANGKYHVFLTTAGSAGWGLGYTSFDKWKSDRLDGKWEPFSSAPMNAFATADNVEKIWSEGISHGELVRTNTDQTMTIDPCKPLQYLFQGNDPTVRVDDYIKLPYRLGLITAQGENPVSALCR